MEVIGSIVYGITHTLMRVLPYLAAMGLGFAILSWWSPGNHGRPWWKKRGLTLDMCYWLIVPLLARYGRIGITVLITVYVLGINTADGIVKFFENGHGPLAQLPFWAQLAVYLLGGEFCLYWIHRAFHGGVLWRFHAVHHASEDVDWTSAARFHPLNILLSSVVVDVLALLLGITPDVFVVMGPVDTVTSAMVHANLNWTFGPLKYVLASPVFHRWHHTLEHGDRNFAGTFSIFDWMFGTFYMPKGELPENFGIENEPMPESFGRQLVYPLSA
jgi:sterol desaturase/sphingolipid hydroxylase (fatty acid hydroxylase superfamily)